MAVIIFALCKYPHLTLLQFSVKTNRNPPDLIFFFLFTKSSSPLRNDFEKHQNINKSSVDRAAGIGGSPPGFKLILSRQIFLDERSYVEKLLIV